MSDEERVRYMPARKITDEIAITLGLSEYSKLEHIVAVCEKSGVHTKFVPDYNNIIPTRPYTEDIDGLPVINMDNLPYRGHSRIIRHGPRSALLLGRLHKGLCYGSQKEIGKYKRETGAQAE